MSAPVDVAVGVVLQADGRFLLAQRPAGKPMAGFWEFPGGKLERGEAVFDALVREFDEELGLHIAAAHPWAQRVVVYPHATVRLHFWRSFGGEWSGQPMSREGQQFRWERIGALTTDPWLQGALPVKRWLQLPTLYAISHAAAIGVDAFVARLAQRIAAGTVHQLQLREPLLAAAEFDALFERVLPLCRDHGVRLLVNSAHAASYGSRCDGVHLTSRDLMLRQRRPEVDWCIASCHDEIQLAHAGALGIDAAVLGPVAATASHPGVAGIGWPAFRSIVRETPVPVYAIGGLDASDEAAAIAHGAHGIAMIRGAWADPSPDR